MGILKQGGASETLIGVMLDPGGSPAPANAPPTASAVAITPAPVSAPAPPAAATAAPVRPAVLTTTQPATPARDQLKRVVVDPFDYSAVMTAVQSVFGTQQNIGRGIQALMTTRLYQGGKVVVVDRAKVKEIQAEQDNAVGNRVKQGTGPRIGRISGADAILTGDIVIFGRDDKKKSSAAALLTPFCRFCGVVGAAKKEEKFVVAINYRLIDAETTEIIASGEARGESKRTSTNWGAIAASLNTAAGAAVDMESKNFAETIIGEATQNCVDTLAEIVNKQAAEMKKTVREVDAVVADVSGNTLTITAGSNDGVNAGEVFEILHVDREIKDPVTNEVLDRATTKIGEMTISGVREKVATGVYNGSPAAMKDLARKKMPAQQ
jgi:curli biogenesis system outer membrane secretion channel CsgG